MNGVTIYWDRESERIGWMVRWPDGYGEPLYGPAIQADDPEIVGALRRMGYVGPFKIRRSLHVWMGRVRYRWLVWRGVL